MIATFKNGIIVEIALRLFLQKITFTQYALVPVGYFACICF